MSSRVENEPKRTKVDDANDHIDEDLQIIPTVKKDEERTSLYLGYMVRTHMNYLKRMQASLLRNDRTYVDLHNSPCVETIKYLALYMRPEESGEVDAFFGPMHNPKHGDYKYHVYRLTPIVASPRWLNAFHDQPPAASSILTEPLSAAVAPVNEDDAKAPAYVHKAHALTCPFKNDDEGCQNADCPSSTCRLSCVVKMQTVHFHPTLVRTSKWSTTSPPPEEKVTEGVTQSYTTISSTAFCQLMDLPMFGRDPLPAIVNVQGINLDHVVFSASQYMSKTDCLLHSAIDKSLRYWGHQSRCLDLTKDIVVMPAGSGYGGMDLKRWKQLWNSNNQAACFYHCLRDPPTSIWEACFLAVIPVREFLAVDLDEIVPSFWDEGSLAKNFAMIYNKPPTSVPAYPLDVIASKTKQQEM